MRTPVNLSWRTTGWVLTALLVSLLLFAVGPAQTQDPPGNQTVGAKAFPPAVDTPITKAPRPIIGALREPLDKLPQVEHFQLVGHTIIPNPRETIERGRNGAISLAPPCGYVGNRLGRRSGTGPNFGKPLMPPEVAIVDVSNPNKPKVIGHLVTPLGGTTRELRAIPELNTLIVMNFAATEAGVSVNNFMIYDITDCRRPVLKATIDLPSPPHEFYVWRDPNRSVRTLIYSTYLNADPEILVHDVTNATSGTPPRRIASFSLAPAVPGIVPFDPTDPAQAFGPDMFPFSSPPTSINNRAHALTLNAEGTRAYVANLGAGFYILDSSNLADEGKAMTCIPDTVTVDATSNTNPNLCLRKLNPDPNARVDNHPPNPNVSHSAVKFPGRPYVLVTDERNGTVTCPWAWGRIVDTTNEYQPDTIASVMVPENLPVNCFRGGPGDPALQREFSTHQTTILENLFFISWYSAGLRAWDVSNPWLPSEVGVFVPKPEFPNVVEPFRNSPDVWVWPHPVIYNGLIYTVDENSGLFIVKYMGQRANEVPEEGIVQGNINRP